MEFQMGVAGSQRHGDRNPRPDRSGGAAAGGANGVPQPKPAGVNNGAARPVSVEEFAITIPSDFNAGRNVQERIMHDVEAGGGFTPDSTFAIRIALEEALVNAIKHGNGLDPAKTVRVESRVRPGRAEITIEDEGPGFDRASIPDPTADENLHKCSGRGILLIEAYMSHVEWSEGGRRLKMVKEG